MNLSLTYTPDEQPTVIIIYKCLNYITNWEIKFKLHLTNPLNDQWQASSNDLTNFVFNIFHLVKEVMIIIIMKH